ncbi:internalin [Listeria monocytogenes]|nr:internalin [Listeria monocytogenes]EAF1158341.1 internalin [Listeria monocytogenes]EAH0476285.1 internalin [Listeria monocytogenes]EEO3756988.1 internalin [Listeria monocytogenes]EGE9351462.1 internalin [Listeria monocytogenes]
MKSPKIVLVSLMSLIMVSNPLLTLATTNNVTDNATEIPNDKDKTTKQPVGLKTLKAGQTQSFNDWFPDDNFASEVAAAFGMQTTDNISEEQLATLTSLDCHYSSISDMSGIEKLTGLTSLNFSSNNITNIDLSKNTRLTHLECASNKLASLNISILKELTYLDCDGNKLSNLDVSQNPLLTYLKCSRNNLTVLDISQNIQLTQLQCNVNKITNLDVKPHTQLTYLNCANNKLTNLDVSRNVLLTNLYCEFNSIDELDLNQNTQLNILDCSSNKLAELDVTPLLQLTYLDCDWNDLAELNVSTLSNLTSLSCSHTELTELDVTHNTKLTSLTCDGNEKITKLNLSLNKQLLRLMCQSTSVTELDLSNNTQLTDLTLNNSELTKLDLSHNAKLKNLDCLNNSIQDFSSLTKISSLKRINAEGQTITMPKETLTNNSLTIAVSPDLLDQFGNPMNIEPGDGGVYDQATNTITWENLSTDNPAVTYTFTSANGSIAGTVTTPFEAPQPIKGEDVTVHYLDDKGEKLADDDVLSGNLDDPYTSSAKDIPDYTLTTTPDNATGTFTTTSQSVTYVYTKNIVAAEPVTVNYVDDTGKTLAPSETLNGNVGDTYNATAKQIDGYTLSAEPTNATGQFTSSAQTVNYIYTKNPAPEKGVVEIHYVDEDNKQLNPTTEISGTIGDNYTTEPKTIEGYTLTTTPGNATGTFNTGSQTVTYVYTKNIETAQPITVNYVDANGKTLAPSETLNGTIGDTYKATAKQINGYKLVKLPENQNGTYQESSQTVTFIYTKVTKESQPRPAKEQTDIKVIAINEFSSNVSKDKGEDTNLPITGDSIPWKSVLIGAILSSSACFIWKKKN